MFGTSVRQKYLPADQNEPVKTVTFYRRPVSQVVKSAIFENEKFGIPFANNL
jgi:hypothetical protein